MGSYDPAEWVVDVAVKDNFALAAVATPNRGGVDILDFSDPAAPVKVAHYPADTGASSITISGDNAFLAQYFRIQILDVTTPASPTLLGIVNTVNALSGFAVSGDTLYVLEQLPMNGQPPPGPFPPLGQIPRTMLEIFDISQPSNPVLKTTRGPMDGMPLAITVKDNLAFLTASMSPQSILQIYDISNRFDPKPLGSYWDYGTFHGFGVSSNLLFLSKDFKGVDLLDISDPAKPTRVASLNSPGYPRRLTLNGSLAYVASFSAGVEIFSFTDPKIPSVELYRAGESWDILLTGQPGQNYHVEYTDRFGPVEPWSLLRAITLTNNPQYVTDTPPRNSPSRFYRLRNAN